MFYFTDIHGNRKLFDAAINLIGNSQFIFGGDACDRGDDGYSIMKELIANPNCVYLKGNHEDMFVKAAKAINHFIIATDDYTPEWARIIIEEEMYNDEDVLLCRYNGGTQTLIDWMTDRMPMDFVQTIEELETHYSFDKYDFCHAGCMREVFQRNTFDQYDTDALLWSRSHFSYAWLPGRVLIHGHTPVPLMPGRWRCSDKPILYCGGGKLNMDGGAHFTDQTFVYDLLMQHFWRLEGHNDGTVTVQVISPADKTKKPYYDSKAGAIINANIIPNDSNNDIANNNINRE